jgi:hypothetical protein
VQSYARFGAIWLAIQVVMPHVSIAQNIRGTVVDSLSGRPLEDFAAELLDARGTTVGTSWPRDGGHFAIQAPGPGAFQVRVRRLGYRKTTTAAFSIGAGEAREIRIVMPRVASALAGIRVNESQRCEAISADGAGSVATVWEAARNAFQLVALTGAREDLTVKVHDHSRDVTSGRDSAWNEKNIEREGRSTNPYVSPSADSIATFGYVRRIGRSIWYYAPDASILLSDAFLRAHCFHLQRSVLDDGTLIGVAFAPLRSRLVPDIKGVVWLDRATSELRFLDFAYTSLPPAARSTEFGGHVEFQRIPGGAWLIHAWSVRAPIIDVVATQRVTGGGFGAQGVTRTVRVIDSVLTGIHEEGGEVLVARSAAGDLIWASEFGSIEGRIVDSTTRQPVSDATIELSGSPRHARSDADGRFRIDSILPGEYTLMAQVASIGTPQLIRSAQVRVAKEPARLEVMIPVSQTAAETFLKRREEQVRMCNEIRQSREREIAAASQVPIGEWHPSGRDSLSVARAVLKAAVVLEGIGDTTGTVLPGSIRAVRRGPSLAYTAALEAMLALQPAVEEPLPGCKVRRLILLPYRVTKEP